MLLNSPNAPSSRPHIEEWLPAGLIISVFLAPVYIQATADSPPDKYTIRSAPPPHRNNTNHQGPPAAPICCRNQSPRCCRCPRQNGWLLGATSDTLTILGPLHAHHVSPHRPLPYTALMYLLPNLSLAVLPPPGCSNSTKKPTEDVRPLS